MIRKKAARPALDAGWAAGFHIGNGGMMTDTKTTSDKIEKSEAEWRKELTPMQYAVLREKATERPFSGEYEHEHRAGTYVCAGCGQTLFESAAKFDSGCGWPSFTQPAAESHVDEERDRSHGMIRTEVLCSKCSGHLGHVFNDGPGPTGLRGAEAEAALRPRPPQGRRSSLVPLGGTNWARSAFLTRRAACCRRPPPIGRVECRSA
jgi:peptide-methionine (R)-S-oxide reductase